MRFVYFLKSWMYSYFFLYFIVTYHVCVKKIKKTLNKYKYEKYLKKKYFVIKKITFINQSEVF